MCKRNAMKKLNLFAICFLLIFNALAQEDAQKKIITAGFQLKPILANTPFLSANPFVLDTNVSLEISPTGGYALGMVVRRDFNTRWSFETGMNLVKRTYRFDINDLTANNQTERDFQILGYQVPVLGLVYVRLGDKVYMNTSAGATIDIFTTEVKFINEFEATQEVFNTLVIRRTIINSGLLANLGVEYRTTDKGYFYFGFSYHRPFIPIADARTMYLRNNKFHILDMNILGDYFTIDLRYFFNDNFGGK